MKMIFQLRLAPGVLLALLLLVAATAAAQAQTAQVGVVNRNANLRAGPSTSYAVVGSAPRGTTVRIAGRNEAGDWLHLSNGRWIAAFLVDINGAGVDGPVPVLTPRPTAAPAAVQPAATPAATPTTAPVAAPAGSGNDFVLVEKRLWDVYENGGWLDGESVHCGDDRQLIVTVLDRNGSRMNGVAVQVEYGAREIEVTGSQGKGAGNAEFVLGGGQDVKVIRDNTGAAVTSDLATGLSTNPANIGHDQLIAARYCTDEASCRRFAEGNGCIGHFSWSATFQQR
jgi:hypothetical protein